MAGKERSSSMPTKNGVWSEPLAKYRKLKCMPGAAACDKCDRQPFVGTVYITTTR
jgi:hypothetical protein